VTSGNPEGLVNWCLFLMQQVHIHVHDVILNYISQMQECIGILLTFNFLKRVVYYKIRTKDVLVI